MTRRLALLQKSDDGSEKGGLHELIFPFFATLLPSLLLLALCWPGYFQADHQATIASIALGAPSEWHSLLWGYIAFPLFYYLPSYAMYGVVQVVLFAGVTSSCIVRLKSLGVVNRTRHLVILYALAPTYLFYNLLYASDIVFAILLMPLTVCLIEIVLSRGKAFSRLGFVAVFFILLYLLFELRKNAVVAVVVLVPVLFALYPAYRKQLIGGVACLLCGIFATSLLFSSVLHAEKSPSQELLSVPAQQIARTIAEGRELTDAETKYLESVRSIDDWRTSYLPGIADPEKDSLSLTPEFIGTWASIGLRNPGPYVRAYLDLMHPFWQMSADDSMLGFGVDFSAHHEFTLTFASGLDDRYVEQFSDSAHNNLVLDVYNRVMNLHVPIVSDAFNLLFFNRALPLWAVVIGAFFAARARRFTAYLIVSLPVMSLLLGFLVFSPVASFRYAVELYYCLPMLVVFTVFLCRHLRLEHSGDNIVHRKTKQIVEVG